MMADENETPKVVPVEDVKIDMEAKAKEYDTRTRAAGDEYELVTQIKNFSKHTVHVVETHFWHGRPTNKRWPELPFGCGVQTAQVGTLPEGVKWGIVYADGDQASDREFVVVVHCPTGKIYAESGPIGPVDWDVVEVKLDQYSTNKAEITDPIYGSTIVAEIYVDFAVASFYI